MNRKSGTWILIRWWSFDKFMSRNKSYTCIVNCVGVSFGRITAYNSRKEQPRCPFLRDQGCSWEHLQLSSLHEIRHSVGGTTVQMVFGELPFQELAVIGGAVLEDRDQLFLQLLQIRLSLALANFAPDFIYFVR